MINTAFDSSDMVDFARMATDLSDYANTSEATLSPFGIVPKGREDHALICGGHTIERYSENPLFA